MRIGAARALDVQDVALDTQHLELVHRPDTGTSLKNGTSGERLVAISDGLTQVRGGWSPHAIRRGSITHFLTNDVPVQIVSDRIDINQKTLEKHYDRRSPEVKLEQRRGYLDHI